MVYKRVRGRISGRRLPVKNFVKYPPGGGGNGAETKHKGLFLESLHFIFMGKNALNERAPFPRVDASASLVRSLRDDEH